MLAFQYHTLYFEPLDNETHSNWCLMATECEAFKSKSSYDIILIVHCDKKTCTEVPVTV